MLLCSRLVLALTWHVHSTGLYISTNAFQTLTGLDPTANTALPKAGKLIFAATLQPA